MSVDQAVAITEDYPVQGGVEIDTIQYSSKEFSFWQGGVLQRSVARYRSRTGKPKIAFDEAQALISPEQIDREEITVLDIPSVFRSRTVGEKSVNTLQEWECVVVDVDDAHVTAMANSLISPTEDQHYIEIPLMEFQEADRSLLNTGVVFRLIVGFVRKASGSRTRESLIYVRHKLPRKQVDFSSELNLLNMD